MNPALLFLIRRSLVTGIVSRLKRLKSPRYLIPTVIGVAYFALIITPWRSQHDGSRDAAGMRGADFPIEWIVAAMSLLLAAWVWVVPSRGAPLAFLEPEVAILFPAPVPRRDLVRYKLLDMQKYLAASLLFVAIWVGLSSGLARGLMVFFGGWLSLNVLTLHQIGARFTRQSLLEHGAGGFRRQALPLLVLVAFLLVLLLGAPPLPGLGDGADVGGLLREWLAKLGESPAGWALYPFRLLALPALAPDLPTFLLRCLGPAVLVAVLYLWVMRTDTAFEEAAAEQAVELTRRIDAAKKGRFGSAEKGKSAARRSPWRLGSIGPPEVAFVWKSVTESLRTFSPRLLGILVASLAIGLAFAKDSGAPKANPVALAIAAGMLGVAGLLIVGGPSLLGSNLRQDLENVETLKTLPISGARLVRSTLAGAVAPTAVLQALLVAGAAFLLPDPGKEALTHAWRLAGAVGLMFLLPSVAALSAVVDSAGALYFPAWVRPGQAHMQGGIEGMGYGIVTMLAKALLLGLGNLLPALVGVLVVLVPVKVFGTIVAPAAGLVGAVAAAAVILAEVWILSELLGRRFERLDPAAEGIIQ